MSTTSRNGGGGNVVGTIEEDGREGDDVEWRETDATLLKGVPRGPDDLHLEMESIKPGFHKVSDDEYKKWNGKRQEQEQNEGDMRSPGPTRAEGVGQQLALKGGLFDKMMQPPKQQHPDHHPLSPFQKGLLGVMASWGAFQDPRRADLVAVVGETTGVGALKMIQERMLRSEEGRVLLKEKPRVTNESILCTEYMHGKTFGGVYAEFMRGRGFEADARPRVRFVDDPELAWIAARSREIHDFWHVLFDCHTDVLGEAALKAVEFVQTGLPMTGMAVVAAEWRLEKRRRDMLNRVYLPWAVRAGAQAADLMTIYYEKYFEESLEDVRKKWRIVPAPV